LTLQDCLIGPGSRDAFLFESIELLQLQAGIFDLLADCNYSRYLQLDTGRGGGQEGRIAA
jgi:hypothetical protein